MKVLKEDKNRIAVLGWGRFNPPTIGHQLLGQFVRNTASKVGGTPMIYSSHTYKKKKDKNGLWGDPLPYEEKAKWLSKVFGNVFVKSDLTILPLILKDIYDKGYEELYLIAGSDRIDEYRSLVMKYNGVPDKKGNLLYNFKNIDFVPAGEERDDSAVGVASVSGTGTRKLAFDGDFEGFKQAVPFDEADAKELFDVLRAELGAEGELDEELLGESQTDVIGQITINANGSSNTYDVFSKSRNTKGALMGDPRLSSSWNGVNVDSIEVNFQSPDDIFNGLHDNVTVDTSDRHVQFIVSTPKGTLKIIGAKGTGRGGGGFTDRFMTGLQEVIMGMILKGVIRDGNIKQFLTNSIEVNGNTYKPSGVFEIGLGRIFKPTEDFYNNWISFVNLWGDALQVVYDTKGVFYSTIAKIGAENQRGWTEQDIQNSTMLHSFYNKGTFINKQDVYDKSDVYFCLDNNIAGQLNSLTRGHTTEYCELMESGMLEHKILGVSLKRPSAKSIRCEYDIPGFTATEFDKDSYVEYHYNKEMGAKIKTVNLRFVGIHMGEDPNNYPVVEVRSDGGSEETLGKLKYSFQ